MARVIVRDNLDSEPRGNSLMKKGTSGVPYECPHFGGNCLGDGCINWTPIGGPPRQQNGQCLIERGGEPIHQAECERKAANADRWAEHYGVYAVEHNAPRALVNQSLFRYTAGYWRWLANGAPARSVEA